MRKQDSATFKAEVVKEEKIRNQIASETGVHPMEFKAWKTIALAGLPALFGRDAKVAEKTAQAYEKDRQARYAEIGRLMTPLHGLKKRWPPA